MEHKTSISFDGKTYHYPKIWTISDWHWNHEAIIRLCDRPFVSVEDMNEFMLQKVNDVVSRNDLIIFCGDFCYWKSNHKALFDLYMSKIVCQNFYFVFGNHDYKIREHIANHPKVRWSGDLLHCEISRIPRIFFHYPIESFWKSGRGSIHYHGHVHNSPPANIQNRINVSVEMVHYSPLELT